MLCVFAYAISGCFVFTDDLMVVEEEALETVLTIEGGGPVKTPPGYQQWV